MTWSYSEDSLDTTTAIGRLNSVRLLVGDTDPTDQLLQDEEINYGLAQTNNNMYYASAWCASTLAAKFARRVTTELNGQLKENYSDLSKQYFKLSAQLRQDGTKYTGTALGLKFGGTEVSEIDSVRQTTDRVKPSFTKDQFKIDSSTSEYDTSYNND